MDAAGVLVRGVAPDWGGQHRSIVGAGLLAKASGQSIAVSTDPLLSRASPLPQSQWCIRSAFNACFKTMSATFVLRAVIVLGE
ncbi:hypothetical protein C1X64_14780 [Pseudomonas sp. GW456-E7]|nr:hypothetical protein C1X64_14780 [Pseudomonas sp. GW456-E7]